MNDPAGSINMSAITVCVLTAICILKSATAQDLNTTCPAPRFTEGVSSDITCTVNRNFYGNSCLTYPNLVTFIFARNGSITPWCDTSYTACETTGQAQTACDGCSCQCSNDNPTTNITKYSLTFVPHANYNGGSFYCQITCTFPSSPVTTNHSSCANATVGEVPESNEGLSTEEEAGIGGGAAVVAIGSGSGVIVFVIKKTKIYVFLFFPEDQDGLTKYKTLQEEIAKMWGVGIGKITPKDKEKYKDANYVIYISKLSGDQQKKLTEVKDFIEGLGGRLNCGAA